MCLILRKQANKPYNNSSIRYKLAEYNRHGDLCGPYRETRYRKNHWHRAQMVHMDFGRAGDVDYARYGYHVFIDKKTAIERAKVRNEVLLTVRVKGFIRSGHHNNQDSSKCETWEQFKILEVDRTHYKGVPCCCR